MVGYHDQGVFYVIQSENNTISADRRQQLIAQSGVKKEDDHNGSMEVEQSNGAADSEELPAVDFGYPRAQGSWASCIQVVDPVTEKTVTHTVELNGNQSLVSAAMVFFESHGDRGSVSQRSART